MLQLRRIRTVKKSTGESTYDTNFEPDILVESHEELFKNLEKYISQIPEYERYNCHYTLGDAPGGKSRGKGTFISQRIIPFDIDGIELTDNRDENKNIIQTFTDTFFRLSGFDKGKTAVVFSGHGLHFLVAVEPWTDKSYFRKNASSYSELCRVLEEGFREAKLKFKEMDRAVFAPNHMLRLPGTLNKKPGKKDRMCQLLSSRLEVQDFPWQRFKATKEKPRTDHNTKTEKTYSKTDSEAVQSECLFLKHAAENQEKINETQWYAALSVWGRLEEGRTLCHRNSSKHPKYNLDETETKINQALGENSGPRTCENIGTLWSGCNECPHHGKITSPINIKGEDFIATEKTGFHKLVGEGEKTKLVPEYDDLRKFFAREMSYKTSQENGAVWVYDGKMYDLYPHTLLRGFAGKHFSPQPMEKHVVEFTHRVTRMNHVPMTFFEGIPGSINFNNGVLDLATRKLTPHSPEFGFLYVLPYDYIPGAKCPEFDAMMKRITCNDPELEQVLLESVADAICDRTYDLQMATILVGEGSNGKSFFLDVVRSLVGEKNVGAMSIKDMDSSIKRHMLKGKLINLSDEMPSMKNSDTDTFKKMMGGDLIIEKKYQDPITMRCTTKLMFATNELPHTNDNSHGMFRRLLLIPFDARFDKGNKDKKLKQRIQAELPGIFNRVLDAFDVLQERGAFLEAKRSVELFNRYRDTNDIVKTYISENLVWDDTWDENNFITFKEIMLAIKDYAGLLNERNITGKKVSAALLRVFPKIKEREARKWNLDRTKYEQGYHGVRFISADKQSYTNGNGAYANGHAKRDSGAVDPANFFDLPPNEVLL